MPTLAVATRKGLLLWDINTSSANLLNESHLGARVSFVEKDPRSGMLYACLDHGHWGVKLQRSADMGKTWTELEAPKYPEGTMVRDEVPANLKYIWAFTPAGEEHPGRIYIGTEPGGLFVAEENGDRIEFVQSLWDHPSRKEHWMGGGRDEAGIHSIVIDPNDANRINVGISVAGVFETTDGGVTWNPRNTGLVADFLPDPHAEVGHDPHLFVQCESEPHKLWQQNHCGVFRSVDYGQSWQKVSEPEGPVGFGFTIVVDPNNGDIAWVVPAVSDEVRIAVDRRLFVAKTTDGGKTWQKFDQGLPQQNCYDFAFRHNLVLDGDFMALGTAGGALYYSHDRGESWDCVSEHLPQIYCLKVV